MNCWCCQRVLASVERALTSWREQNRCLNKGKDALCSSPRQEHRFRQLLPLTCCEHPADTRACCSSAGAGCPLHWVCCFGQTDHEPQTVPIDTEDLIALEDSSVDKCSDLSLCSRQYPVDIHPSCPQTGISPHFTQAQAKLGNVPHGCSSLLC